MACQELAKLEQILIVKGFAAVSSVQFYANFVSMANIFSRDIVLNLNTDNQFFSQCINCIYCVYLYVINVNFVSALLKTYGW